jgi:hypothetical protein
MSDFSAPIQAAVAPIIAAAKAAGKAELDAAFTAAGKLLVIAAGDVSPILTKEEALAVPFVENFIPAAFRPEFSALAAPFIAGAEAQANTVASADLAKYLAVAQARIAQIQAAADAFFK